MAITNVELSRNAQRRQFVDVFSEVVEFEAIWDAPSVNSNDSTTEDIPVSGAHFGDMVHVSIEIDLQGLIITAYVKSAGVVTVVLTNPKSGAVNLDSAQLHFIILHPTHIHNGG